MMSANFRKASLALLLAGLGGISAAHAGLGPIHVLSADGEAFSAEIPVVNEDVEDFAQANLADRNHYPLLSPYSASASVLQFNLVRGGDGHIQKVLVRGPASFNEPLLRFAVEVHWPAGSLVREFEVDYKRDGPRRKAPAPAGGDDGKHHAATPDQGSRLDGAGLGDLRVSSRLGEPLLAELPLLGGVFDRAEQVQVAISSDIVQSASAREQLQQVASIAYRLERAADGRRVLQLSSALPITSPRLSFRLEVAAGNVKAQKVYALALDKAAPVHPEAAPAAAEAANHYSVRKGDTLSGIAARMRGHARGEDVATRLLKDNPDAFIRGDANKLLAGAELRYPAKWRLLDGESREAAKPAPTEAKPGTMAKLLADGRQADHAQPAAKPPVKAEAKPVAAPQPKPEAKPAVKALPPAKPAASATELAAEHRMRSTLLAQDQALKATEQRTRELEQQLRAIQQGKAKAAAAHPAAPAAEAPADRKPAETAKPSPGAMTVPPSGPSRRGEHAGPPAVIRVETVPVARAVAPGEKSQPKPAPRPVGMVDQTLAALNDRDVQIKLGGAAAALALVALLLIRRKRSGPADEAEPAGGDPEKGASALLTLGPLTSLMGSLKKGDGIDLGSVDVMAEAEVYLAYGRDDQVIAILREALEKEPMRQDLRYKLLEVLAAQQDKEPFVREATVTKGLFDPNGTLWMRVCELGRDKVPGHPLFQSEAAPETAAMPGVGALEPEPVPASRPAMSEAAAGPAAETPPAPTPAPVSAPPPAPAPAARPAPVVEPDKEKMELAKLYLEMGDKETADTLIREAQQGR
ncbi:type IV pilus assembly protein FimV [Chromobacterium sp. CV08]|uniref:type IV pilus assembly protein FimV n=1 Tax=Chromobacterium sp. CV08 TaxID=3133274 RepID=UPI003DA7F7BC